MTLRTATRRAFLYPAAAAASSGWWLSGGISAANAIAVYQPKGAASLAASYVNLANPGTYDAAPGTAPTFDTATGWTFDGSTQYLDSGVIPADGYTMIVRYANRTGGTCLAGTQNASTIRFWMRTHQTASSRRYGYGDNVQTVASAANSGVMAMAGTNCYFDGVSEGTAGAWAAGTHYSVYIGARNLVDTSGEFWAGDVCAVAIYDTTLTSDQVAAVSTAMAAL